MDVDRSVTSPEIVPLLVSHQSHLEGDAAASEVATTEFKTIAQLRASNVVVQTTMREIVRPKQLNVMLVENWVISRGTAQPLMAAL